MALDYSQNPVILSRVKDQLRPYQIKAVAQGLSHGRILLDMYMGLGKTVTALAIIFGLRPKKVLILCGQAALGTWIKEIREWFPEYSDQSEFNIIRAKGQSAAKRKEKWSFNATFYICTLQTFLLDMDEALKNSFDLIVGDEVHKWPKHTTKTYKKLKKGVSGIKNMILMTGSWIKRHAGRGWRHLHLLSPRGFPSYWKFINRYCITYDNGFGKTIAGPKNTEEFYHVIKPYVFRYHDLEGNVPKTVRKLMWVDMSKEQQKVYTDLSENMFSMLDSGELILSSVSIATFMKHRQLLACPKILSPTLGMGAAFDQCMQLVTEEYADDSDEQHFVMFYPFRKGVEEASKELERLGYPTWQFMGGMDGMVLQRESEAFRSLAGKKSVAVCTIDFAESFQLGTSKRGHFMGLAYDNDTLKQAEARLARADSDLKRPVIQRYWLHNETLQEESVDVLRGRAHHVRMLFKHMDEVKSALRIG